jgi:serine protease Do
MSILTGHLSKKDYMIRLFSPLCLLGLALSLFTAPPAPAANPALRELNDALVGVFEKVAPAVVVITVERKITAHDPGSDDPFDLDSFFRNPGRQLPVPMPDLETEGSGFFFRPDGYILTNHHVVEDAAKINVKLLDGRTFEATVVGADKQMDIAVLKVNANDVPVLVFANSDKVRVGQIACAIGTPYNLDYTFTLGVVSAKGRGHLISSYYEEYIQTDASINPGNSGGPLFDIDGEVIGMNTLINGINRGIGFAIPSNLLKETAAMLVEHKKILRPWLGIRIETLDKSARSKWPFEGIESGVVVVALIEDGPAFKSDLRQADVIVAVDGVPVKTTHQLQREIFRKRVGQPVKLTVRRGDKTLDVEVVTAEIREERPVAAVHPNQDEEEGGDEETSPPLFGLKVQNLDEALRSQLKLEVEGGVIVTEVEPGSPAEVAGLRHGDVITEADSKPVQNAEQFRDLLSKLDASKGVLLFVDRQGEKTYAVLKTGR